MPGEGDIPRSVALRRRIDKMFYDTHTQLQYQAKARAREPLTKPVQVLSCFPHIHPHPPHPLLCCLLGQFPKKKSTMNDTREGSGEGGGRRSIISGGSLFRQAKGLRKRLSVTASNVTRRSTQTSTHTPLLSSLLT